jgi:hypothetical protein
VRGRTAAVAMAVSWDNAEECAGAALLGSARLHNGAAQRDRGPSRGPPGTGVGEWCEPGGAAEGVATVGADGDDARGAQGRGDGQKTSLTLTLAPCIRRSMVCIADARDNKFACNCQDNRSPHSTPSIGDGQP